MPEQIENILPEDRDTGAAGRVDWFLGRSPFEQAEIRRQVAFRRANWPGLPGGISRAAERMDKELRRDIQRRYVHILPDDCWELNVFEDICPAWKKYVASQGVEVHEECANLVSSQIACFNFLFALRDAPEEARRFFAPILPSVAEVTSIEFEETGDSGTTAWLGEPPNGARGKYRTSADVAIRWKDSERERLTYVEWKYTETTFGPCGGHGSRKNKNRERCDTFNASESPFTQCYVSTGRTRTHSRRYWEHLRAEGSPVDLARLEGRGCPFRGPLWQLMRLELLAERARRKTPGCGVDVAVVHWSENTSLLRFERGGDVLSTWRGALRRPERFQIATIDQLLASLGSCSEKLQAWRTYLLKRYGR